MIEPPIELVSCIMGEAGPPDDDSEDVDILIE
jgi:hypothetical protein